MNRELEGLTIAITRPLEQSNSMTVALAAKGATTLNFPTIRIAFEEFRAGLVTAMRNLSEYDWIVFTSINGVKALALAAKESGIKTNSISEKKIAVIGKATKLACEREFKKPEIMPDEFLALALPTAMKTYCGGNIEGQKILLARADIADKGLPEELKSLGASVVQVSAYSISTNWDSGLLEKIRNQVDPPDMITFTSPSTFRGLNEILCKVGKSEWLTRARLGCIGPVTAKELSKMGFNDYFVAKEYSAEGLVEAIVKNSKALLRINLHQA